MWQGSRQIGRGTALEGRVATAQKALSRQLVLLGFSCFLLFFMLFLFSLVVPCLLFLLCFGRHCSLHQGPHCLILNRNRIPQIPQILGQCSVAGSLGLAESGAA